MRYPKGILPFKACPLAEKESVCQYVCDSDNDQDPSNFEKSLNYGNLPYLVPKTKQDIQAELMMYGTVQAVMKVYGDFSLYSNGFYHRKNGKTMIGYHSVKLIGWETLPNTTDTYWIAINSWGTEWGENGLVK